MCRAWHAMMLLHGGEAIARSDTRGGAVLAVPRLTITAGDHQGEEVGQVPPLPPVQASLGAGLCSRHRLVHSNWPLFAFPEISPSHLEHEAKQMARLSSFPVPEPECLCCIFTVPLLLLRRA